MERVRPLGVNKSAIVRGFLAAFVALIEKDNCLKNFHPRGEAHALRKISGIELFRADFAVLEVQPDPKHSLL